MRQFREEDLEFEGECPAAIDNLEHLPGNTTLDPFSLQELLAKWNRLGFGERIRKLPRSGTYPEVALSRGVQKRIFMCEALDL